LQSASVTSISAAAEAPPTTAPFQIGGRLFTAIVLQLNRGIDASFYAALDARLKEASNFFAYVPLVLDLGNVPDRTIDFRLLVLEMRTRKLTLAGIQNATAEQKREAAAAGLVMLRGGRDLRPDEARRENEAAKAADTARPPTRIVGEHVRSGQRVFSESDLVILGSVGSGAEVMAIGNIHVYGALRGRALAGAKGDAGARIFCHSMEAELLAIAGTYGTSEDLGGAVRKQAAQVYLRDDEIVIEPLK
jgi:septum site-determining protein MinC